MTFRYPEGDGNKPDPKTYFKIAIGITLLLFFLALSLT